MLSVAAADQQQQNQQLSDQNQMICSGFYSQQPAQQQTGVLDLGKITKTVYCK